MRQSNFKLHFYVDESGNTGTNLFDENQPMLHYGVLSSQLDLDKKAVNLISAARTKLNVARLHATELGFKGLENIVEYLFEFERKFNPEFGIYRVAKLDYALMCFFDQVFDQGLNPAVTWSGYWTPLRYILLFKLSSLFDIDTLKDAWNARIELDDNKAEALLSRVCKKLLKNIHFLPDKRSQQIISDVLQWASSNPEELHYNCNSEEDILTVTPNIVGFQLVMHGIANRVGSPDTPARIIVDRQSQFNKAQKTLARFYEHARDRHPIWMIGPGMPVMDLTNIPKAPIEIQSSSASIGLELVDIYLWLTKRVIEGTTIRGTLRDLLSLRVHSIDEHEVSLESLHKEWSPFFENLPELTPEKKELGKKIVEEEEKRRQSAIKNYKKGN